MVLLGTGVYNFYNLTQQNEELRKTNASLESEVKNVNKKMNKKIKKKDKLIKWYEKATDHRDKVIGDLREDVDKKQKKIDSQKAELISKAEAKKKQQSRMIASSKTTKTHTPQTKVSNQTVHKSSKSVVQKYNSNIQNKQTGNSSGSGREMTVTATAYTADCAGCSGITATGINLKANRNAKVIAVDPSVIPLGSRVWVEGYGTAIAGDTGGAIKNYKIDLHVPTKQQAMNYGRKQVKIKILN